MSDRPIRPGDRVRWKPVPGHEIYISRVVVVLGDRAIVYTEFYGREWVRLDCLTLIEPEVEPVAGEGAL